MYGLFVSQSRKSRSGAAFLIQEIAICLENEALLESFVSPSARGILTRGVRFVKSSRMSGCYYNQICFTTGCYSNQ